MNTAAVSEGTRNMLAALWEKNLPIVRERVIELQRAAVDSQTLSAEARHSAEAIAHKLAGSLGMFGYKRGTDITREMEQMLEGAGTLNAHRLKSLAEELQAELKL